MKKNHLHLNKIFFALTMASVFLIDKSLAASVSSSVVQSFSTSNGGSSHVEVHTSSHNGVTEYYVNDNGNIQQGTKVGDVQISTPNAFVTSSVNNGPVPVKQNIPVEVQMKIQNIQNRVNTIKNNVQIKTQSVPQTYVPESTAFINTSAVTPIDTQPQIDTQIQLNNQSIFERIMMHIDNLKAQIVSIFSR